MKNYSSHNINKEEYTINHIYKKYLKNNKQSFFNHNTYNKNNPFYKNNNKYKD